MKTFYPDFYDDHISIATGDLKGDYAFRVEFAKGLPEKAREEITDLLLDAPRIAALAREFVAEWQGEEHECLATFMQRYADAFKAVLKLN